MNAIELIDSFYRPGSLSRELLVEHGYAVAEKARAIAFSVGAASAELDFIHEASLLHDIGIFLTRAPRIGCFGDNDYLCHGYLGRSLVENSGFPLHALVCERHVGTGLTASEITAHGLPLPRRDMLPTSRPERIICYADKFFSKNPGNLRSEKSVEEVRTTLAKYGQAVLGRFDMLHQEFSR